MPTGRITRRQLLKAPAGVAAVTACATNGAPPRGGGPRTGDLIRVENRKAGTTDWMLTNVRIDPPSRYRSPWIEGYCSRTSVRPGQRLELMVSTNPPAEF